MCGYKLHLPYLKTSVTALLKDDAHTTLCTLSGCYANTDCQLLLVTILDAQFFSSIAHPGGDSSLYG